MIKISRPIQKDIYLRRRLFEKIDQMRDFPVIWISAPAGAGKTTLVSSFIKDRKIPCLWYRIDKGDEDLASFFYYIGQAITKAAPRHHKPMPLLTAEYYQGIPTFTLRYFEELYRRLKVPFVLVLDNYQEVSVDSPFHEMINGAISRTPTGVNMVVISRSDPPPAFIRLKANSHMELLRWGDLRLTKEEAQEFIHSRINEFITPDAIRHLYRLSDGWAAGLVLIMEAMKRRKIQPPFVRTHALDEVFIYFAQEVFNDLDLRMQEFLMRSAFLPQMTDRMAEELIGDSHAGEIFQVMSRNNYFITKHIHSEAFYEYHALYRDFLLAQAGKMLSPETVTNIKRSAAVILENAGQIDAAVSLLKDIGNWEAMATVIISHAPEMLKQGRYHPLRNWLDSLPSRVLDSNPWLLYFRGLSILPFEPQSAKSGFERAFVGFQSANDDMGAILAASGVVQAIAYSFDDFALLDHWFAVLNDVTARIEQYPNEEIKASVIASMIMASVLGTVLHPDVETWAERALEIVELPATVIFKVHAIHFLLWYRLLYRGARGTLPLFRRLEILSRYPYAQPLSSITFRAAQVQYNLGTGLHHELMDGVNKGLAISRETGVHVQDLWLRLHAIMSLLNRRDLKSAEAWIEKMSPMVEQLPNWVRTVYHGQLARMALIKKDLDHALSEGKQSLYFANKNKNRFTYANAQLMLVQICNQTGRREEALEYLEQGRRYFAQTDCRTHVALASLLEAQFAFERGDNDNGLELLRKSFVLARECDFVFGLVDDPAVTVQMCEKALEEGIEAEYVRTIIRRRGLVPDKPPLHIEDWPWAVKIYTLGRFSLVRDDAPVAFSRKAQQKPLALLKALIALGGSGIKEERLTELLWPDAEGDMAHQSFETTLHRLRRLLGRPEALIVRDGRVTLDNRYCWVDVWAFERLLGQADELRKKGETGSRALVDGKGHRVVSGWIFLPANARSHGW